MPLIGHLDPDFLRLMDECKNMIREVFQTNNRFTLATPGTGTSGMEAAVMNMLEPGDRAIIGTCGYFGNRIVEMAERTGAEVIQVDAEWGSAIEPEAIRAAAKKTQPIKLIAIVHAETSTGVQQPIEQISEIAKELGALLLIDCVTSLGGIPVQADKWEADILYSGTQKCLSAPPGASPITLSEKAVRALSSRKTLPNTWYLDLQKLEAYWDNRRAYHHTSPISMLYALHRALAITLNEGLENRWERHERNGRALQNGLEALGLVLHAEKSVRLSVLTTVRIPEGIDGELIKSELLSNFSTEIAGGLGVLKGKIWRIGLMGESSTPNNVLFFLSAFGILLRKYGFKADVAASLESAAQTLKV
tara:strand:- start:100 stop:1185 length:1086 start_codon:yes stop_codon:yes gene_type:complete